MARAKRQPGDDSELVFEKVDWRTFGRVVIGVDEVGRGCLAGPVAAAACLFACDDLAGEVTDSKKLTPERREELSAKILAVHPAHCAYASVEEIDEINILQASFLAMRRAIAELEKAMAAGPHAKWVGRAKIVVDGHLKIPGIAPRRQTALVKGDLRCAPISAASIVAKVARDRLMSEHAVAYPGYGFESHKGYSTERHKSALSALGPTPLHRRTFAGVKELYLEEDVGV